MHILRSLPKMAAALAVALVLAAPLARPQSVQTTTVTGTVYSAGGAPVSGTLQISWPAFTTAAGQSIAAGHVNVTIPANGQISVPLAPNIGATPAGLYYTAVYHLSDGTTSTEYWVVPNSIQTTIGQIRSKLMPAAQAVQAVSKAYVDQSIAQAVSSQITPSGGTLTGPLYLAGDPSQPNQASNKHYVDTAVAGALPLGGGTLAGPVTATKIGAVYQADQFPGADFGAQLQACINALDTSYGGTCDARNFEGQLSMAQNLTVSTANSTIYLPCSTIATAASIVVPAGTRNVTFHGCASRGTSVASGAQGGTVFAYSGSTALLQVGDPSFAADTKGFRLDNAALNTTAATSASAQAIALFRTQEISLASLYLLGNATQTALTLDGTGNYTGGTFEDLQFTGYQTSVNAIGHTISNPATTDWLNASTFVRIHIDCPTSNGNPVFGTVGINLNAGDGNTITGGDVESCSTALHLGPNAVNNTILGLRNENSTTQIQADPGSSYNNWITGGTMFTGKLVDNGTRNSFLDTFHRSFNALNGDWYGSQQDATVTNHFRLGTGTGNERGLLNRYQTDYGYRWTAGLSDASAGIQYYQVLDELNNVYRLSIGQYNNGQPSSNNQTVLNAAGTGAVLLNGSNNSGTGGVVFGSGGPVSSTVATVDKSGNAHFTGTLLTDQTLQSTGTLTVRNNADAEVDYYLWPGATGSQKGSFTYKDYDGSSQWYLLKDKWNNWALNSAVGGLDSFKAYQSTNSGDTYINASNATGHIRLNYETGAGAETDIYSGSSSSLAAAFLGPTAIKLPGLAASSGRNCLQIDNSGYITNTTTPCSTGSGNVGTGSTGQIAYYTANGTALSGTSTVPLAAGGTGAATAAAALANLGALPLAGGTLTGPVTATQVTANQVTASQFSGPVSGNVTGNVSGNVSGNLSGNVSGDVSLVTGLTFADKSVQTTSQQGALTGAANDSAARTAAASAETDAQSGIANAAAAQTSANSALNGQANDSTARTAAAAAQTTASAALPANGATSTGAGTANVVALPGLLSAVAGVDLNASTVSEELPNNTSSGATLKALVCVNGSGQAQTCTTSSTNWSGVAVGGATGSTAGSVLSARLGQAQCTFDGASAVGDYVQISATVAGDCHDAGSSYPASGAIVGRITAAASGAGQPGTVNLYGPGVMSALGALSGSANDITARTAAAAAEADAQTGITNAAAAQSSASSALNGQASDATARTAALAAQNTANAALNAIANPGSGNGTVLLGSVMAGTSNNVINVGTLQYPTLASAIAALPSTGGTVFTPPGYTESVASVDIGSRTQTVTVRLGKGTRITVTGGNGSTGIRIFNGSDLICDGSTGTSCTIVSAQTGTPLSLLSNGQQDGTQEYFHVRNLAIDCGSTVTYANGCVDVNSIYVPSSFDTVMIYRFNSGIGLHIHSDSAASGGLNVFNCFNCWISGGGGAGSAQPVVIERTGTGSVSMVHFYAGAIEHVGSGQHELAINGHGTTYQLFEIALFGTQIEGKAGNMASSVYVSDAQLVGFYNVNFSTHPAGTPCIELAQTVPGGLGVVTAEEVRCTPNSPAIQNDVNGTSTPLTAYELPHYTYNGDSNALPSVFDGPVVFTQPPPTAGSAYSPALLSGPNYIANLGLRDPSFESGTTNWSLTCINDPGCAFAQDATTAPAGLGSHSGEITIGTSTGRDELIAILTGLSINAGQTYTISYWAKSDGAVASASYVGGGTFTGVTGNCTLTSFNNSSTATASIAVSSGVPGIITITSPGTGATATPTSATLGSPCSGTVSLSTTLSLQVEQHLSDVTEAASYGPVAASSSLSAAWTQQSLTFTAGATTTGTAPYTTPYLRISNVPNSGTGHIWLDGISVTAGSTPAYPGFGPASQGSVDGTTLTQNNNVISCAAASTSQSGCVKLDGTTITSSGGIISATPPPSTSLTTPAWLTNVGDSNEGAYTCTSGTCNLTGEHWYSSFNVSAGATVAVNNAWGLVVRTPSATINGTIDARGSVCLNALNTGLGGGAAGGSGAGAANGTTGTPSWLLNGTFGGGNGFAGAAPGGNGGNGVSYWSRSAFQAFVSQPATEAFLSGGTGKAGGSSGGAGGDGGCGVILVASTLSGTGTIMADGQYGSAPVGNSTGAGSGGGGPIIISARANTSTLTLYQGGGTGGQTAVPWAPVNGYGGTGAWLSLTVASSPGPVTACAVGAGGAGYPPGTTIPSAYVPVLGGGGSGATVTATTNSSGVVSSCAVTAGGSTYTSTSYTGAGSGGNGYQGPNRSFAW